MRRLLLVCALLVSLSVAMTAVAASRPRNLVATPQVKAQLRAAFLSFHHVPKAKQAAVKGPLPGTTYYGSYGGHEYAVSVFSVPPFGSQDQPEVLTRLSGGRWRDTGDTGGEVCPPRVPLPLLRLWHWQASSQTQDPQTGRWHSCYTP